MENIPYELIARYFAGECNEDEKQQVQEWNRLHPDLMAEISDIWQQIPSNEFTPDVEQALQHVSDLIEVKKKGLSKRIIMWAGSAAAVILLLVSIIGIRQWSTSDNTFPDTLLTLNTNVKETLEYTLPDGSKVWLNQSSALRYPEVFAADLREVYLEGEAFFDVSPDAEKPFVIYANNTLTRVVGTSFGLRAVKDGDEVIVTVSTGIIRFSTDENSESIELRQGEQGICEPKQRRLEKNADPDPNMLAWKTKTLIFRQTPLSEVAVAIEDVYHTPVSVDDSVAGLQLTSTFDQLSLEEVMQIIEMTLQVESRTEKGGILLTDARE